jgi:HSP90 family molecular chaperone
MIMANSKMTKKDWFAVVKAIVEASDSAQKDEAVKFIDHEVELLSKKSAKSGQTKTQKENVAVMEKIKTALASVDSPVTISELMKSSEDMAEYSNQKLSALLKKLVESGEVVRTEDKKKAFFSLPTAEEDGE